MPGESDGNLSADSPEGRNAQREHCRENHVEHEHLPSEWWCCKSFVCRHTPMEPHNAGYVLIPSGDPCGARNGELKCILSKGHTKPVDHWNGTFGFTERWPDGDPGDDEDDGSQYFRDLDGYDNAKKQGRDGEQAS